MHAALRTCHAGMRWLLATAIMQAGTDAWAPTGDGKWCPENGGPSNGGQWLHEIEGGGEE